MIGGKIATRYAKALYELAEDKQLLSQVYDDLQGIASVLEIDDTIQAFLENPVVNEEQKKLVLTTAFKSKVQPIVSSLLNLLVDKGREQFLYSICKAFFQIHKEKKGYREVLLTTATPANNQTKETLEKELSEKLNSKVVLKTSIDENLIGGFKLRIDDMLMDKSIATQLANIKKKLLSK